VNHAWNQWVLGFNHQKQQELLQKLGLKNLSWNWLISLMISLIAMMLAVIAVFSLLRRPRQKDPVLRLYLKFCSKLEKAGILRNVDEGPTDFAVRAIRQRPDLESMIQRISRLYIRLRYTRHASTQDLESFRRLVQSFRV
jgi:hypothetical protein